MLTGLRAWFILVPHIAFLPLAGQYAVLGGGGDGDQGTGSIAFSIGQVAYMPMTTPSGGFSLGVQQTYPDFQTAVEANGPSATPALFPNPASNEVILRIPGTWTEGRSVHVCDASGRSIHHATLRDPYTVIDLHDAANGSVLVELRHNGHRTHVFRVIKQSP